MSGPLFSTPYLLILVITVLLSPLVLTLASSQKKETKRQLKLIFLIILSAQFLLGFFSWQSFESLHLGLFLLISLLQITMLQLNKHPKIVVVLNFVNSILFFYAMITLSNSLGYHPVSIPAIGSVFLVLTGNIIGLAFINNDKNLLKKYL